ncbi:MAG: UMP kinase [candidate division Zixibacteria bacterium]|nr:UMP kinase [candidate division Zixibacteria bacterium]
MGSEPPKPTYKRVLLKISGESLMGDDHYGINTRALEEIGGQIKQVKDLGVEIALVIGGGNIFRGLHASERGMDRVTGDNIGMLATVINSLAMMDTLEKLGIYTRVMSAVRVEAFAEPYIRRRAVRHMEKGRLVILAAGTGNPFFSTDTAASLRAMELSAEVMIKATRVDGVYSADPEKDSEATFYSKLKYMDVLTNELKVMDATAISLLKDHGIPVLVINIKKPGNLVRAICGESVGTMIS